MQLFGFVLLRDFSGGGSGTDAGGGTPIGQVAYFLALVCAVFATPFKRLIPMPLTLLLALGWCWFSLSWAIAPDIALRRVALLTIIVWTQFLVVQRLGFERSLQLLRTAFAISLAVSLFVILVVPSIGVQSVLLNSHLEATPGWRGILIDKNAFGAFCAVTLILFLFHAQSVRPALRWGVVAVAAGCLLFAQSKTSLAVGLAVIPIAFAIGRFRFALRPLLLPIGVCVIVALVIGGAVLIEPFRAALYEPEAFTGRGRIWGSIWRYITDHPLLGAGFGSFWSIGYKSPIFSYAGHIWVTKIAQGHNGYLDLWATIGLPGLLLVVTAVLLVPMSKAVASSRLVGSQAALFIGVLLFCAGNNLTESTLFSRETFLNVIVITTIALLSAAISKSRQPVMARREAEPAQIERRPQ